MQWWGYVIVYGLPAFFASWRASRRRSAQRLAAEAEDPKSPQAQLRDELAYLESLRLEAELQRRP